MIKKLRKLLWEKTVRRGWLHACDIGAPLEHRL